MVHYRNFLILGLSVALTVAFNNCGQFSRAIGDLENHEQLSLEGPNDNQDLDTTQGETDDSEDENNVNDDVMISATYPKNPSSPRQILRVPEDYNSFQAAYSIAQSGDHIVLAEGDYAEDFELDRSFDPSRPVVIRSASTDGANPGARILGQFRVSGAGHWLHELTLNFSKANRGEGDLKTLNGASHLILTRNWIRGKHGLELSGYPSNIWIGWNRFTGKFGPSRPDSQNVSHIFLEIPAKVTATTKVPKSVRIYRNYFWDNSLFAEKSEPGGESMSIYVGHSHPKDDDTIGRIDDILIVENYIEYQPKGYGRGRSFYFKWGIDVVRNNILPEEGEFGQRSGWGSHILGNRIAGINFMVRGHHQASSYDKGTFIINNISSSPISLYRASSIQGKKGFIHAAHWVTLSGNKGDLLVGTKPDRPDYYEETRFGDIVKHVRIYAHNSTPNLLESFVDLSTLSISNNPLEDSPPITTIPSDFNGFQTGFEMGYQGAEPPLSE